MAEAKQKELKAGKVIQVMGPVVDVEFPPGDLPEIFYALRLTNPNIDPRPDNLVIEVAQHLGENTVRCIAMDTTDGLVRGQPAKNTGGEIRVPVGAKTLGRIMNVIGDPVDERGPLGPPLAPQRLERACRRRGTRNRPRPQPRPRRARRGRSPTRLR